MSSVHGAVPCTVYTCSNMCRARSCDMPLVSHKSSLWTPGSDGSRVCTFALLSESPTESRRSGPRGVSVHSRIEAAFVCVMDDFTPSDEFVVELDAFLTSTGCAVAKLPGGVAGIVRAYLMNVDVGVSVDVIKALSPDLAGSLISDAEAHTGRTQAGLTVRIAIQWWCSREAARSDRDRDRDERGAAPAAGAGGAAGGAGAAGLAFGFGGAEGEINDLDSVMGAPMGEVAPPRAGLFNPADLIAHGTLDPLLLLILTGAMVSGVVPSREAAKVCMNLHNSDWRVSPHMHAQRKAKIPSLWDVLAKHSYVELESFWQEGINSLSERSEFHKCALLANQAWSAVVQSMGTGDGAAKAIGEYWWEYLTKRYRGRGIPVVLDTSLVLKYRQAPRCIFGTIDL